MSFSTIFSIFISFCKSLFRLSKSRVILSLFLMMFLGLTGGFGLLMLIPLLQLIGFQTSGETLEGVFLVVSRFFRILGIPMNFTSILIIYILIICLYAVLRYTQSMISTNIQQNYTIFWRSRLYKLLTYSEWLFIARGKSSDLAHILTNETRNLGFTTHQLLTLLSAVNIILVHVVIALILSPEMTIIAIVCASVLSLFILPKNRRIHKSGRDIVEQNRLLFSSISEHLGGIKIAKSFGSEDRHIQNFQAIDMDIKEANINFQKIRAGSQLFYDIGGVIVFSILFFIAFKIFFITPATLLLLLYIFARLLPKVSSLQQNYQNTIHMMPSYEAILDLEEQCLKHQEAEESRSSPSLPLKRSIEFKNVYFRYARDSNRYTLENINLNIPAGQNVVVMGASGAGKSTFADLIIGLTSPEQGEILLDGEPLRGKRLYSWRHSIGYVPQDVFLFHDTIRANLLWSKKNATEKELWEASALACADKFIAELPEGLDTVIGDRGSRFSGGERQRISLTRALLRKPSLLVLDEATSFLDEDNSNKIQDAIKNIRPQMTVLIIAHTSSAAKNADLIIVFDKGRIIETGTWDKISSKSRFNEILKTEEKKLIYDD